MKKWDSFIHSSLLLQVGLSLGFLMANRKSITHSVFPFLVHDNSTEESRCVHSFCFPFDWQFLAPTQFCKQNRLFFYPSSQRTVEKTWPKILLQITSTDSWGRYRIEGYTFIEVPKRPGYYELLLETWKPYEDINAQVHDFFLGGSKKILEFPELAATSLQGGDVSLSSRE